MSEAKRPAAPAGEPDRATVTSDGTPLAPVIDGVRTKRAVVHVDHRGRVFEVVNHDTGYWRTPIVHTYVFTIRPAQIKGWGWHAHKLDRYCLVSGEVLVLLWDGRAGSPTEGLVQEVVLTAQGVQMVTIPTGVWHIDVNLGPDEAIVINHPTEPYDYERPDRRTLPWDSPEIPVDVSRYLPLQWARREPGPQR